MKLNNDSDKARRMRAKKWKADRRSLRPAKRFFRPRMYELGPDSVFENSWRFWPELERWLNGRTEGFTVSIMSGKCPLGDLKIDLFTKADVKADALYLPLKNECADTVIVDPPYVTKHKKLWMLMNEIERILKVGGRCIFIYWAVPAWHFRTQVEKVFVFYANRNVEMWTYPKIVSISRKTATKLTS